MEYLYPIKKMHSLQIRFWPIATQSVPSKTACCAAFRFL